MGQFKGKFSTISWQAQISRFKIFIAIDSDLWKWRIFNICLDHTLTQQINVYGSLVLSAWPVSSMRCTIEPRVDLLNHQPNQAVLVFDYSG